MLVKDLFYSESVFIALVKEEKGLELDEMHANMT